MIYLYLLYWSSVKEEGAIEEVISSDNNNKKT